jgi:pimeloyl-ACP methyl ester carboxylesterase
MGVQEIKGLLVGLSGIGLLLGAAVSGASEIPVWTGTDLQDVRKNQYLGAGGQGRIVQLNFSIPGLKPPHATQECGAGVVFVYGAAGQVGQFRVISERLRRLPLQQYYFDYDDRSRRIEPNARDLSRALREMRASQRDRSCRLIVVAHSMGGVMGLSALNYLSQFPEQDIGSILLITIDSPWHGYGGPNEQSFVGAMNLLLASPFMPTSYVDLVARSRFYSNLYRRSLPRNLALRIYFADESDQVFDYTEDGLRALVPYIRERYLDRPTRNESSVRAEIRNFWMALVHSDAFSSFDRRLSAHLARGTLSEEVIQVELLRHFPRFRGDHGSVLDGAGWQFPEFLLYEVGRVLEADMSETLN